MPSTPNGSASAAPSAQAASSHSIWYFVAATFLFAGSSIFGTAGQGRELYLWIGIPLGVIVLFAGSIVLGKEVARKRETDAAAAQPATDIR